VRGQDDVEIRVEPVEQGSTKAKLRYQPRLASGEGAQARDLGPK